jgi:hypothetical protein
VRRLLPSEIGMAAVLAVLAAWMRRTRIGAGFTNGVVNPSVLLRRVDEQPGRLEADAALRPRSTSSATEDVSSRPAVARYGR